MILDKSFGISVFQVHQTSCVCEREREREKGRVGEEEREGRERERERERERTNTYYIILTLFPACMEWPQVIWLKPPFGNLRNTIY